MQHSEACENVNLLVVTTPHALKLVEDAVVLVQVAQLASKMVVNRNGLQWPVLHVDVPDLQIEVVARQDVSSIVAELDIRDGRDDFGEE